MSRIVSFITKLLSSPSFQLRQVHAFPDYITVLAESAGGCHVFADRVSASPIHFKNDTALNLTCWTLSSMPNDDFGRHWENPNASFIWAWVDLPAGSWNQSWMDKAVGNLETGGIAGGHGCWMHEDDMKDGEDLYLPDEIRWCGDAPHHQVGFPLPRERRKLLWEEWLADLGDSGGVSWTSGIPRRLLRLSQLHRSGRDRLPDHIQFYLELWRLQRFRMLETWHGSGREHHLGFSH